MRRASRQAQSPDTIIAEPDRINGISIQDQGSPVGSTLGIRPLIYRAPQGFDFDDRLPSQSFAASSSYVTGSHSFKVGFDMQRGYFWRGDNNESTGGIWYRTREYVPNLVTIQAPNAGWQNNLNYNLGIYAQDRWTVNRLTLSGGIRVDMQNESTSDFTSQPHRWMPTRNQFYPAVENVPNWKDINPRVSVAYDLFGTGKTAIKASASRGVEQDSIRYAGANNPANTLVTQVSREWKDTNNNFTPDCDLLNSQPNGECLVWQDLGFGSSRVSTFYDPRMLEGWGVRGWNWEFSSGVQHEIIPRLSASVGYFRRIYGNFNVVDNEALSRSDFTEFSVVAPTDAASGAVGADDRRHLRPEPGRREPQRREACIRFRRREIALERGGLLDRYAAPERGAAAGRYQHRQDDERLSATSSTMCPRCFSPAPPFRRGSCWSESAHRRPPSGRQPGSVTRRRRSSRSTKRLARIRCRTACASAVRSRTFLVP